MKFSLYIGTNKYSLSTEDDILKLSPANFECQYKILIGNINFLMNIYKIEKIVLFIMN